MIEMKDGGLVMLLGLNISAHTPINIANTINKTTKNKASLLINFTVFFIFIMFLVKSDKFKLSLYFSSSFDV